MTSLSYAPRPALRTRDRVGLRNPEIYGLLGLTAVLNLWNLGINGWANTYYSAAVRSMSASWHNFLFASLDQSGLMTVDKPPLAYWVQALSVRVFGFHPLSILVPEALMGVVAVGLVYDLTRRQFGRVAGFVAGLALAFTPITVAVARHNNPDELLVLCCVAALWCAVRALEAGRTRWIVLSGVCVGLGFEAKMGVALLVVPGIAVAYLWAAPAAVSRLRALGQLVAGGVAMAAVGLAWPLLVTLTPAADRPWISGTSDNSVWSLIFGYNGLGRVAGQTGGPAGAGGAGPGGIMFGGATGPFRLLQSGMGDQAGWLLGFAVVAALTLLVLTRARRRDPRTGWVLAVGGALLTSAVVFSFAQGIFHPYYVSFLAPFAAALVGAGFALMLERRATRVIAPLLLIGGITTELVVVDSLGGALGWATPLVMVVAGLGAVLLAFRLPPRLRAGLAVVTVAALLAAPAAWAAETLGHATNGTFPAGGSAAAATGSFGPGRGGDGIGAGPGGFLRGGGPALQGGPPPGAVAGGGGTPPQPLFGAGGFGGGGPGGFGAGGPFGGDTASLTAAVDYARAHGGGTIALESQSSAAAMILASDADVAGIGGFSGRESTVSPAWLATEVQLGRLRWVVADGNQGPGLRGDTRAGSQNAIKAAEQACKAVTVQNNSATNVTMYDCQGRASAILSAARG